MEPGLSARDRRRKQVGQGDGEVMAVPGGSTREDDHGGQARVR